MASPKDRPPKRRNIKRRPLPGITPAMQKWIDYGVAELESLANGAPKENKLPS